MNDEDLYPWGRPGLWIVPDNGHTYDERTLNAKHLFAAARAEAEQVQGTPRAWVTYKQSNSLARILDARAEGIHVTLSINQNGEQTCSCALVVPASYNNPLHAAGHLSFTDATPVQLILGITTRAQAALVAERLYGVRCQRCDWDSALGTHEEALVLMDNHQHRLRQTAVDDHPASPEPSQEQRT